jgi:hypothetical protein
MENTGQNITFENIETDNPQKQGDTFAEIDPGHGTREVRVRDTEKFVERCNESGWDIKKITRYVEPVDSKMAGSLPMTNQR